MEPQDLCSLLSSLTTPGRRETARSQLGSLEPTIEHVSLIINSLASSYPKLRYEVRGFLQSNRGAPFRAYYQAHQDEIALKGRAKRHLEMVYRSL